MKKLISVILCICLVAAGCSGRKGDKQEDHTSGNDNITPFGQQDNTVSDDDADDTASADAPDDPAAVDISNPLKLNEEWAAVTLAGANRPDYMLPNYMADVEPYTISKDLSNIENIQYFHGFTNEQKETLVKNGFVVIPAGRTKMSYIYDNNEYLKVPNFVTTDSVLHLYHQFYDKSLMYIETNFLYNCLDTLTSQMLEKSIRLAGYLDSDKLKELQEKNIVYFLVARMLMVNNPDMDADVNEELKSIARSEYELIDKAEGYQESPLFEFDLDYSQFTVRGHYTRSEELGRFFKVMMWFGLAPIPLMDSGGNIDYDNVLQALLIAYTTFMDTDYICDAELWNNIYQPTKQFVGASDDINVFRMNGLRLEVFGEANDPNIFDDEEYYDKLIQGVKDLPSPKIMAKYISDTALADDPITTPAGKQFRYMGQRYIMDSYIMQELINPIDRPMPTALDVMGVLGSKTAEDLLFNYYKPQEKWPEYTEKYNGLKEEVAGYDTDVWGENLYNGWLWAIQENLTEFDEDSGMPFFMTTEAWRYKSLNAALGSYTELKHDTILYGKQAAAEGGNGVIFKNHYHYVEPNVELYYKLLYLTDYTIKVLRERNMLERSLENGAESYKELLELLINCSIKELRNEMLSEEEYNRLLYYGAAMEYITDCFTLATGDYESIDISDMLAADIATNPGAYLTLGTGYFDQIFVVIPVDGKLYLSRGAVYSTYEFISDKRLTDEEWWALNGITIIEDEYVTYVEKTEPSGNLPEQPWWVKKFKSFENTVEIDKIDVEWEYAY